MPIYVQEAHRTLNRCEQNRNAPRKLTLKMPNLQNKESKLKAERKGPVITKVNQNKSWVFFFLRKLYYPGLEFIKSKL